MSSQSSIERTVDAVTLWIKTNFPTYLTRANLGQSYQAPAMAKCEALPYIPGDGPFPYIQINLDEVPIEPSGQGCQMLQPQISVNVMLKGIKKTNLAKALMRYMDALVDAVAGNITMGGAVQSIRVTYVEKTENPTDESGYIVATLKCEVESEIG